ncbi:MULTISPECIES: TetR/AcrR family transcriptional regulator [unclassified Pseudonocardia]|uniref:TetR/AcrR family transcriptional regulator n=1 Tax=unclassified Pseudonocardia TaxID=2619320 RepID=UPI0001FFED2E|nr:TetR/AcrR family transcriptional regulator [Pseudonocardia sp. Ae707_Ps1]OLM19396.1 Transcriptional regulator, TetR family [Pseudonocardia sp. Ae707_Ps1]
MGHEPPGGTRNRLLRAAADLIAASPGETVPLRAICDAAGVRLPTLYHFFGSKEGLLDAVVEHGFEQYLSAKQEHEPSGDPIQDIRDGWDAHVEFGIANPGFYALMYGQVTPGRRPAAQERPTTILLGLTRKAAARGRLAVEPDRAAAHILAANIGVTLQQIITARPDPGLSADMREATIAAVTGGSRPAHHPAEEPHLARAAATLLALPDDNTVLGAPETVLLKKWLADIARLPGPAHRPGTSSTP